MACHNKTLDLMASKLGLGDEDKVLSKAAEFERLLQTKSTAGSNMSDTGKVVICLDLAASIVGIGLDVKTVIKYSGWKPSIYSNNKKIIENLLELNSNKLSVPLLCVTLQCGEVQNLAERILQEYRKQAKMAMDLNLPQYACMAVYQACRISKVRVSKSKVIEKSRLRPAQWTKLDADWAKLVDSKFAAVNKKTKPTKKAVADEIEEPMEVDEIKPVDNQAEPQIEPYEVWKQRMLKKAHKELKELENSEKRKNITPRKSPRKTPQKFVPYQSPAKVNGVRLLFPTSCLK
ncbi:hypothetical protein K1T71_012975 [Dendrolimus kikuchii]|uniref:Uncharacterized protein n=1 Tax=Dendrolimus kikuchii TaxID=765133 RepID=A0ACC1CIL0_9NEOP|nr:hypothetical protein K1T71_012975 [Dendrolimus kikuchii]